MMSITSFGRDVALTNLQEHGYHCHKFEPTGMPIHIFAFRDGQRYLVSVVPRNHTNADGTPKEAGYNLHDNKGKGGGSHSEAVRRLAGEQNAILAWMAVTINAEEQKYDCYFGLVADLENPNLIPMAATDRKSHGTLCENRPDNRIKREWSNLDKGAIERPTRR
jgi:hypothetical protein